MSTETKAVPLQADAPHSLSFDAAVAHVTATNPAFALTEALIDNRRYPVFANAPATVPAMLARSRAAHADGANTHLVYEGERLSFDAFTARVASAAAAFRSQGVGPGDRVGIVSRNYPEMLVALFAVSALGGVAVLMNAWWTAQELEFGVIDSGPRVIVADGPRLDHLLPVAGRLGLTLIGIRDGEGRGAHDWSLLLAGHAGAPMPEAPIAPDDDFAII